MASLVGRRPERCAQFFVDDHLDRDADFVVDQVGTPPLKGSLVEVTFRFSAIEIAAARKGLQRPSWPT